MWKELFWADGCARDTGRGSFLYMETSQKYPGITRYEERSYCGRPSENRRWYVTDAAPNEHFARVQDAQAFARTGKRREGAKNFAYI